MKLKPDVVVEDAEGELIVLDKEVGKVHQFNQSASLIWNGLAEGLGTDEIADKLAGTFDVEHNKALSDVLTTVHQFEELGLVEEE